MQRRSLTDILRAGGAGAGWINGSWGGIAPAPEYGAPIPRGVYVAHVADGALFVARTGTPGYKLTFEVAEGEHCGRRIWHDVWLTDAAKRAAVRDLAKLGITSRDQLESPIPPGRIRCRLVVVVHTADDGTPRNVVKSFDVIGVDPPEADPFGPADAPPTAPAGEPDGPPADGAANGHAPDGTLFPPTAGKSGTGPYAEGA